MDLYQEADGVLEASHIEPILREFGDVLLEGSYVYRTMVDRDIDFKVVLHSVDELTLELRSNIASKLSNIPILRSLQMADIHRFPGGAIHVIDGIWFGLTLVSLVTNERWNVDVWFVGIDGAQEEDLELTQRLHSLSDDERATILAIKQAALDDDTKEKGITSVKIYQAVLNRGIKTYQEFLALE